MKAFQIIILILFISILGTAIYIGAKYDFVPKDVEPISTPSPQVIVITPTPAPTPEPTPTYERITITKHPTSETKPVESSTKFIADATNFTSVFWLAITPSGEEILAEEVGEYFAPTYTTGYDTTELSVYNVSTAANGLKFYARFSNEEYVERTDSATLTVENKTTPGSDTSTSTSNPVPTSSSTISIGAYTPPSTIPATTNYLSVNPSFTSESFICNGSTLAATGSMTIPATGSLTITNISKTNSYCQVVSSKGVIYEATAIQHVIYIDPNTTGGITITVYTK